MFVQVADTWKFSSPRLCQLMLMVLMMSVEDGWLRSTVTSHARHLPRAHCSSFRYLLVVRSPNGSFVDGTPARRMALHKISLTVLYLICLPMLLRQESPCMPVVSTVAPQSQVWGWHRLAPRRYPADNLISSSDIRSQTAVIWGAKSQSPACGCLYIYINIYIYIYNRHATINWRKPQFIENN